MKKEYVIEILILLFLFTCLSLISFWAYKVFFADKNTHVLYFKDVDGIVKGSPVRFMGVVVGHVSELKYQSGSINVKILITKRGVDFPKGSTANVQFTGIAGSKSIEIEPPKGNVQPYALIMTQNPLRVKDIFEYSKSYTNALLSIENQLELMPTESIYKVIQYATYPYDWSNIDNMLDTKGHRVQTVFNNIDQVVDKEKNMTNEIDRLNKIFTKKH